MTDRDFMARAVELAARGLGHTRPNPAVGAVIAISCTFDKKKQPLS